MKKKESVQYTIEREFSEKYTAEELLIRIVRSHLSQEIQNG